jgi:hypothetical protein
MKNYFAKSLVKPVLALSLLLGISPASSLFGCATCGCSFDAEWESQGYSTEPGFKLDLIYNFIDQTQLRHGSNKISPSQVPLGQELESYTRNNYITLGFEYDFNQDWGIAVQLPYIIRSHATFGEDHNSYDTSSSASIGDLRLIAHYQGFLSTHNLGVELGIKLPTGTFTDTFDSGDALDRGLQPGTGTTDLIAGLYYFDTFATNWSWFTEATLQTAFNYREDYKPGTAGNFSVGVRYTGINHFIPQLQVNARISHRDTGEQSDNFDSGGTVINLSPGVTYEVNEHLSTFVFVQIPVYQNLYGYQLAPTYSLTAGIRATF